jgi:hypothetical protein
MQAERVAIERQRLIQISNRYADVIEHRLHDLNTRCMMSVAAE